MRVFKNELEDRVKKYEVQFVENIYRFDKLYRAALFDQQERELNITLAGMDFPRNARENVAAIPPQEDSVFTQIIDNPSNARENVGVIPHQEDSVFTQIIDNATTRRARGKNKTCQQRSMRTAQTLTAPTTTTQASAPAAEREDAHVDHMYTIAFWLMTLARFILDIEKNQVFYRRYPLLLPAQLFISIAMIIGFNWLDRYPNMKDLFFAGTACSLFVAAMMPDASSQNNQQLKLKK